MEMRYAIWRSGRHQEGSKSRIGEIVSASIARDVNGTLVLGLLQGTDIKNFI